MTKRVPKQMSNKHPLSARLTVALLGASLCGALSTLPLAGRAQATVAALGTGAETPAPPATGGPSDDIVETTPYGYKLAPDDQIEITVQGYDSFNKPVTVLPDGTFQYFGKTYHAAGMTQEELTLAIKVGLKRQLRKPQVTISVRATHPRKISVTGAVRSGQYDFKPGLKLLEFISLSGGPVQAPELTRATLLTASRGMQPTSIDLVRLMSHDTDPTLNVPLHPGDILLMEARPAESAMVQVAGQVARIGQYPVPSTGATVLAMLTMSGGALPGSALSRVEVVHNGDQRILNMHSTLFGGTSPEARTRLYAGDTVLVPVNNDKYYMIGDVAHEGINIIPDGETWTVSMALTAAGGATDAGDKKKVEVARAGPGGRMVATFVNVEDLYKANNKAADIVLKPGDIVYVPRRHQKSSVFGTFQGALGGLFSFKALQSVLKSGL